MPVILRTSDEESELPTPERHMIQVTNPFRLEIGFGSASVSSKEIYCIKSKYQFVMLKNEKEHLENLGKTFLQLECR